MLCDIQAKKWQLMLDARQFSFLRVCVPSGETLSAAASATTEIAKNQCALSR